jgi:hypothetical protein
MLCTEENVVPCSWTDRRNPCTREVELYLSVPDHGSRYRNVVLVRRTISLGKPQGVGKLEWGGNGEGTGRER